MSKWSSAGVGNGAPAKGQEYQRNWGHLKKEKLTYAKGLSIPANRVDGATGTLSSVLGSDPKWPTSG
jgi:hypothetical protein